MQGNVTTGGRYGHAPDDQPHMEPEVPARGIDNADVELPGTLAGALPENRGVEEEADEARE